MNRYFPRSRRLIIIFSHQDDAPSGPGEAGGAAGLVGADWLAGAARAAWPRRALPPGWPGFRL